MNRLPVAPSIGWSLMLIGIFTATSTMLSIPCTLWRLYTVNRPGLPLGTLALISSAAFVITAWMAVLLSRQSWRELFQSLRPAPALFFPTLVMALGMSVLCSEIHNWTIHLIPMPKWFQDIFSEMFNVGDQPVGAILALSVVAPITEEFICRRWILESLLQRFRPAWSIALGAVVFGLMHLNPWQFFYATVLGAGVCWLYWRTRSVALCIFWHMVNNTLAVVLASWSPDVEGFRHPPDAVVEFQPAWLNLTGLGVLLVGAAWTWWLTRRTAEALALKPNPPPPLPSDPAGTTASRSL